MGGFASCKFWKPLGKVFCKRKSTEMALYLGVILIFPAAATTWSPRARVCVADAQSVFLLGWAP
jgi:hypothetical protein